MATVYSNTRHPKFIKWSCIAAAIVSVICWVFYFIFYKNDTWWTIALEVSAYTLLYSALYGGSYLLYHLTIDEENDTITNSGNKKYPLKISRMARITYKESKKGRFRGLDIHDDGVGFMTVRTSKANADRIVAQLLQLKPTIEVRHANYI